MDSTLQLPQATISLPFPWRQGEHLTMTGDTGSGKSSLGRFLSLARQWFVMFRSKADTVDYGARRIKTAGELSSLRYRRLELSPGHDKAKQWAQFHAAMELVWKQGGWTVYLDELYYLDDKLGLGDDIETLFTQGRSKHITVMAGLQRPTGVTRFALSQATHNISFGLEGRDVRLMREINERWAAAIAGLHRFEFAWFYRPTRQIWVGRIQDLGGSVK
jgi:hypothetical protein